LLILVEEHFVRNVNRLSIRNERPEFPQKSKIESQAFSRPPQAEPGQWNALWLGTYFVVASKRGSIGC
jgi:hypothetical protein